METTHATGWPQAVLFDLLTALLDSWTLWNESAGSEAAGRNWRAEYLRLTYGCGAYVPYEDLVRQAASNIGLGANAPAALEGNWQSVRPWEGAMEALQALRARCKLAVVTNCSSRLGKLAARRLKVDWDRVGLRTYWHNRVRLSLPPGAPAPEVESPTLAALVPWLQSFQEPEDLE
jgi:2-haloacid dehalogenase